MTELNLEAAMGIANTFLRKFDIENEAFSESENPLEEYRLGFQRLGTGPEGEIVVWLAAGPGYRKDDPEIVGLGEQYIRALRKAHPELDKFRLKPWIFSL